MDEHDSFDDRDEAQQIPPEVLEQVRRKLMEMFGNLKHEVPLLLFTDTKTNTQYCEAARSFIRAVRELSSTVSLRIWI